jgi:hypothetical protein
MSEYNLTPWKKHYPNSLSVMGEYELIRGKVHNGRPVYRRAFMGERFVFYNTILSMWVLSYVLQDDHSLQKARFLFGASSEMKSPDRVGYSQWSVITQGATVNEKRLRFMKREKSVFFQCSSCQGVEVHIPESKQSISVGMKGDTTDGLAGTYMMDSEVSHGKPVFRQETISPWYLFYMEVKSHDHPIGQWVFGKKPRAYPIAILAVSNADSPDKIYQKHKWEVVGCTSGYSFCHRPIQISCSAATPMPTSAPTYSPTTILQLWRSDMAEVPTTLPTISPTFATHPTPNPTHAPSFVPTIHPTPLPIPGCKKLHVTGKTPRFRDLLGWYTLVLAEGEKGKLDGGADSGPEYIADHPVYSRTYMGARKAKSGASKATKLEQIMKVEENWESGFVEKRVFLFFHQGVLAGRRLSGDDDDQAPGDDDDGGQPNGSWAIGPNIGAPPYFFVASSAAEIPDNIHPKAWKVLKHPHPHPTPQYLL